MAVSRELSSMVRLPVAPSALRCALSTNLVSVMVSTSTSSWDNGCVAFRPAMAQISTVCKGTSALAEDHFLDNTRYRGTHVLNMATDDQHSFKKLYLKRFPKLDKRESSEGSFWKKYQVGLLELRCAFSITQVS